jgi:hypothetical protein
MWSLLETPLNGDIPLFKENFTREKSMAVGHPI